MEKIKLEHVGKTYDKGVQVIDDLNLDIEEGSFTVLLGPSGCGKSTTLRMIAGLEDVTEGKLLIDNQDMENVSPGDRDIAMVFQNYAIYPTMTVYGNIEFGLKNAGIKKEERKRRIEEIGKITGLEEYMNRKPNALSGGQRQRVAIARALALSPDILCFDEPTSALDPELTGEVLKVIKGLADQNTTMIIVTHEMAFARDVSDKVLFMDDGKILEQGTPEEVFENPKEERTRQFLSRYTNG